MAAIGDMACLPRRERGAALLAALVLMLAVLMTGLAGARTALYGARASAHERDRLLALQMAEAALADAERDIEGGADPSSARAAAFATGLASAFAGGCAGGSPGGSPYGGLCAHESDPARQGERIAARDGPAVPFGSFTGRRLPSGEGALPAEEPRYLIELMPPRGGGHLYRITALGTGAMPATQVALQAYYRKPATAGAPGRRLGWREIGNLAALRDAASHLGHGGQG